MSAEAGYESEETVPLRISGFLALILGLASALALVGAPLLLIPILAMFFGFFALRKYDGPAPVGVRQAKVGLVLAAGFGACGFFLPWMKTMTLGSQAEYFARQYVEIVARGEMELAMELKKNYSNRYMHNMSLKQHYEMSDGARSALEMFSQESVNKTIQELGPGGTWELDQATRVYHQFRLDRADVVLVNYDREVPLKIYFQMVYFPHRDTGVGQWHVEVCTEKTERLVAESIL